MFITAICPTYRRPDCISNLLWLWNKQDYPHYLRHLVILDDGGTFDAQQGKDWSIHTREQRFESLPSKYNELAALAPLQTQAFVVWEDDDIYLPGYISSYAKALERGSYVKPNYVFSDYPGYLVKEQATGRFHSSIGFSSSLLHRIGGWPETKKAIFDQVMIKKLEEAATPISPWGDDDTPQFVFGWHTNHAHGQYTMKSPEDETWWDAAADLFPPVKVDGPVAIKPDDRTLKIFAELEL